ncbi:MAG: sialate O-acetylesterase [Saprospiraceae bacterium]|nr:sialate O-acetylesterase [Saprospiraceae bacterium]
MKYLCVLIWSMPLLVLGQLSLDPIFSDHMVFQQGQKITVWGKAIPGMTIAGMMQHDQQSTFVQPDSSWLLHFASLTASARPYSITISTQGQSIQMNDILIGDLWLCLGQSNMEWPMVKELHYKEAVSMSDQPLLRFYNPDYTGKGIYNTPFNDSIIQRLQKGPFYHGVWQVSDSNTIKQMSAVAYYFGKELLLDQGIPIGLIQLSIGGAPLETLIDREVMKAAPQFTSKIKADWLHNPSLPVWIKERAVQNLGDVNPLGADNDLAHPFAPGFAFDRGLKSFVPLPIKGVIFYQGESNAQEQDRVAEYADLFKLMVRDYRRQWHQPSLPFYYVQLSSIDTTRYKSQCWPAFREEQRKILSTVDHTGMAVSSDVGAKDDVHPTDKKTVGRRLALQALKNSYHKRIVADGPLVKKAKYHRGKTTITFHYPIRVLATSDQKPLRGFSIDPHKETTALIHHRKVIIPGMSKPDYIYYAWQPYSTANLTNDLGLPASTFKIKVK